MINLGWMPQANFEDLLEKTISWYIDNMNWVDAEPKKMKLLVIGKNGQVASALKDITSDDTIFLSKDELDITNYKSIKESIEKERLMA